MKERERSKHILQRKFLSVHSCTFKDSCILSIGWCLSVVGLLKYSRVLFEGHRQTLHKMSSQGGRPPERGYHQDYIARIRYENNLPPPPGAPKLLNIPIEGLVYYTSAAFASRMARQQPLNIEADAELGMPIDLVGMPGIFDGDESCMTR